MPNPDTKPPEGYVLRPFALPIDWLDLTMDIPGRSRQERPWGNAESIEVDGRFVLVRQPGRSRVFDRIDALVDQRTDRVLGLVRSCPHNTAIMPANRVQLKVANDSLYNYTWADTTNHLQDVLGWAYVGISKIDLAADGHGFLAPFADAARGDVSYGGRADFVVRFSNGAVKAAELGTRAGNKFARIYGKSKELQLSGKKYIADYWNSQGCEDVSNVDRCEISVKGREVRRYYPAERTREFLDGLTDPKYRAQVFASVANTFVRFRTGECGDRSRDREDLLSWDFSKVAGQRDVNTNPRAQRVEDFGLNLLKSHIRLSFMIHVATGSPRYLSTAQEVAEAAHLAPWMRSRAPVWKRAAEKLVATGVRAATLFDLLQGCDESDVAKMAELSEAKAAKRSESRKARKEVRQAATARGIAERARRGIPEPRKPYPKR